MPCYRCMHYSGDCPDHSRHALTTTTYRGTTMSTTEKLEAFRALLESEQLRRITEAGWNPAIHPHACRVVVGAKYAKVDVSGPQWSGKYMVDLATGEIFGIKAYGVIHRGHRYGTLDTIADFDWSGYSAVRKAKVA